MKKITFILVGVIYFAAIIIVAFLGVRAEVSGQTIEVTAIYMEKAIGVDPGAYRTLPEGVEPKASTYVVYARPKEQDIDPETGKAGGITWNTGEYRYDYVVQIRNFNPIADDPNWVDGRGHFSLKCFVAPEDATKQDLTYALTDSTGLSPENVTIDNQGMVTFVETPTAKATHYNLLVAPTDNSLVRCHVRFTVVGYK